LQKLSLPFKGRVGMGVSSVVRLLIVRISEPVADATH